MAFDETLLMSIRNNDLWATPGALAARDDITAYDLHAIALMFLYGDDGLPQDYVKTRVWLKKAAAKGCAASYQALGFLYQQGDGVTRNVVTALKYYQKAVDAGYVQAQADIEYIFNDANTSSDDLYAIALLYGDHHYFHHDLHRGYAEAKRWLEKAGDKGSWAALTNLSKIYEHGYGVDQDIVTAVKYYLQVNDMPTQNLQVFLMQKHIPAFGYHAIAEMYHQIAPFKAHALYNMAIKRGYMGSYRSLGQLYEHSPEFPRQNSQHLFLAADYYGTAIKNGYEEAETNIDSLFNTANENPDPLILSAIIIRYADHVLDITQSHEKVKIWLEIAGTRGSAKAYLYLGRCYENGRGFEKNLITAAKYYERAKANGYEQANEDLHRFYNNIPREKHLEISYAVGVMYRDGDNIAQNYDKAVLHFELASGRAQNPLRIIDGRACRALAALYETGLGVRENHYIAARYYLMGIATGHADAQQSIGHLALMQVTGWEWCYLGGELRGERVQVLPHSASAARICFEQAIHKGRHNMAYDTAARSLGHMFEFGYRDININLTEARKYYELGNSRVDLKRIERKIIEGAIQARENLNLIDDQGRTALHRAAQHKLLKLYATLMYFNANTRVIDRNLQRPSALLSRVEMDKVNRLCLLTGQYHNALRQPAVDIIVSRIIVSGANHDRARTKDALQALYEIDSIRPLLDLAKFAMLAKHRLSARPEVLDDGFDSDDESDVIDHQRLQISIDPGRRTVENLVCFGADGHEGRGALGVYVHAMPNTVYVGGNRETKILLKGTLIHELCHFLAKEVFDNHALPYRADDEVNRNRFTEIARAMEGRKDMLDPIFNAVFDSYPREQFHIELIVRAPQFIIEHPDGLARLANEEPELLSYYQDIFLDEVRKHTLRLEQKATGSGWSPAVFQRTRAGAFHLQRVDEEAQSCNMASTSSPNLSTLHDADELDDSLAEPSTSMGTVKR